MRRSRGRVVDVDSIEDFDARIRRGVRSLSGWRVQGVDLRDRAAALARVDVAGALFLGCPVPPAVAAGLRERGAVVFPELPGTPVDAYRTGLYTPDELYDTSRYADSLDARAYAWSHRRDDPADGADRGLAAALHDHAIDRALAGWVRERRARGRGLVGVMGGHALRRGEPGYRDAARLGHALGQRYVVATGGGPGAMEAANLGAFLASGPAERLDDAVDRLAAVPSYRSDVGAWAAVALEEVRRARPGVESLGVPTWHYGHEPPNVFATAVAKYFRNATREAILLEVCDAGIVFLPGAAGTVQEVFQDACENYYADESSVAPMVLVGSDHWTRTVPAWPALAALAAGRPMARDVHLVDTPDEAAALLAGPHHW